MFDVIVIIAVIVPICLVLGMQLLLGSRLAADTIQIGTEKLNRASCSCCCCYSLFPLS